MPTLRTLSNGATTLEARHLSVLKGLGLFPSNHLLSNHSTFSVITHQLQSPMLSVTILSRDSLITRYRIVGTPTSPEWRATLRPGVEVWCEITVWHDYPLRISSYGGEVWPLAWPEYFARVPGPFPYSPSADVSLTDAGRVLLDSALSV